MSKKFIISEEERKHLKSLYENKGILNELETNTASGVDSASARQNLQPQGDKGTYTWESALKKFPCLNTYATDKKIYNNGSYDYVKIKYENNPYNAFLNDGHLYDMKTKEFTQKYLGKEVPCNKSSSDVSGVKSSSNVSYNNKYIDELSQKLQLQGKTEQEKINQIMAELNKLTPKTA
jgi:hypothetical protein